MGSHCHLWVPDSPGLFYKVASATEKVLCGTSCQGVEGGTPKTEDTGWENTRAPLSLRPATCKQNALGEALTILGLGRREGPLNKFPLKRKVAGTVGGQPRAAHLNGAVNH